jgi:hypothetical protein
MSVGFFIVYSRVDCKEKFDGCLLDYKIYQKGGESGCLFFFDNYMIYTSLPVICCAFYVSSDYNKEAVRYFEEECFYVIVDGHHRREALHYLETQGFNGIPERVSNTSQ